MFPRAKELADRVRELLARKASFRLELESYDGKWHKWRIAEHGKIKPLDGGTEDNENRGTSIEE